MVNKRNLLRVSFAVVASAIFSLAFSFSRQKSEHDQCWAAVTDKVVASKNLSELLTEEISKFQELVEESLVARARILSVLENLNSNKNAPLSSRQLEVLRTGTVGYLDIRQRLFQTARRYECTISTTAGYLKRHGIEPLLRSKSVLLSLAAALTLNDNWILAVAAFEKESRIRRLLNEPDSGFAINSNSLNEIALNANSLVIRERVRRAIEFYEREKEENGENFALSQADEHYQYLDLLISSSPSYSMLAERRAGGFVALQLDAVGKMSSDFLNELSKDGMNSLSKFFGNTIGLVESRKGLLYQDKEVEQELFSQLQPLDLLLEKTPFRLTDKFIPGHFGHIAIWLGNEQQLKGAGLWEHPLVVPHHEELRDSADGGPRLVLEALRSGVQLSKLEHFLNVDDVAIFRLNALDAQKQQSIDLELQREALLMAFRQIGKDYDFNFDVNTTEKIVCSELVYVSFPGIDWTTEKVMGRHTISPDNVAQKSLSGDLLSLVSFYHEGKKVPIERGMEKLTQLLK